MARRFRKFARRRRRRVAWFAPRLGPTSKDPTVSCWSDEDISLAPIGATTGPTRMIIPIVTEETQALSPDDDATLSKHPLTERLLVSRIRGSVHFIQGLTGNFPNTNQPASDLILGSVLVHVGICRVQTVGDAWPIPLPNPNDSCLADWLYLKHFSMSTDNAVCHVCHYEALKPSDSTTVGGLEIQAPITSAQLFGVPSMVDLEVDVKVKRNIEPEHGLWMVVSYEVGDPDLADNFLMTIRPFLRAIISKSV